MTQCRLKDGVEIGSAARLKIKSEAGTHSLTVEKSVAGDTGVYEAVVTNSLGEARTKCNINVDCKLEFTFIFYLINQLKL